MICCLSCLVVSHVFSFSLLIIASSRSLKNTIFVFKFESITTYTHAPLALCKDRGIVPDCEGGDKFLGVEFFEDPSFFSDAQHMCVCLCDKIENGATVSKEVVSNGTSVSPVNFDFIQDDLDQFICHRAHTRTLVSLSLSIEFFCTMNNINHIIRYHRLFFFIFFIAIKN